MIKAVELMRKVSWMSVHSNQATGRDSQKLVQDVSKSILENILKIPTCKSNGILFKDHFILKS